MALLQGRSVLLEGDLQGGQGLWFRPLHPTLYAARFQAQSLQRNQVDLPCAWQVQRQHHQRSHRLRDEQWRACIRFHVFQVPLTMIVQYPCRIRGPEPLR